jgi:hypothetical protein
VEPRERSYLTVGLCPSRRVDPVALLGGSGGFLAPNRSAKTNSIL